MVAPNSRQAPSAKPASGSQPSPQSISPYLRPPLRVGSSGPMVELLQTLLNTVLGGGTVKIDRDFGGRTKDAVSLFQYLAGIVITGGVALEDWVLLEQLVDRSYGTSPLIDSLPTVGTLPRFGPGPWRDDQPAVLQPPGWPLLYCGSGDEPQATLPMIASNYVGVMETGDNKIGDNAKMREIFEADDLTVGSATDGYAWCSAFVSLCTQKLIAGNGGRFGRLAAPREPSVNGFLDTWAANQKCLIFSPTSQVIRPQIGDICVFTFSHIGIVESVNPAAVGTIEGNTNEAGGREGTGVWRKSRSLSVVRKFIRLPVNRLYPGE